MDHLSKKVHCSTATCLQNTHGTKMVAARRKEPDAVCQYIQETIDTLIQLKDIVATKQIREQCGG
jgi:hypothetical protein